MYGRPSVGALHTCNFCPQAKFFEVVVAGGYQDVCAAGKIFLAFFYFEPGVDLTIPFAALGGTFATLTHFFSEERNSMMSVMSGKDQEYILNDSVYIFHPSSIFVTPLTPVVMIFER